MPTVMPASSAVDPFSQRCGVICEAVGLPQAVGEPFIRHVQAVGDSIGATAYGDRADQAAAYLVSFAYFGRIATSEESSRIAQLLAHESPAAVDRSLKAWPASNELAAKMHLAPTDADVTYVDVSHTVFTKRNSGIQRVVRQLAEALSASTHRHTFVLFDPQLRGYRELNAAELEQLLDWEKFCTFATKKTGEPRQASRFKQWRKKAGRTRFGQPVRQLARVFRDRSRELRRWLKTRSQVVEDPGIHGAHVSYFMWQGKLLLPELNPPQVDVLTVVLNATQIRSTMLIYDLLPITHPEFFDSAAPGGFARYLTLLRHVDQVSCISNTVREQVESLIKAIPRVKKPPRIAAHLLTGDFRHRQLAPTVKKVSQAETVVLCVGSIEPRKNQIRILRAMVAAQQEGHRFRGVFAGSAGWLNEQFLAELQQARRVGMQVELYQDVSDEVLAELYSEAALTVYCSIAEGFGLPVVESVMAGVPCLTSSVGSMQEIAEQLGGCSLVDPYSPDAIAKSLAMLVSDRKELARLTEEARQARWHSWSDYCEDVMAFVDADSATNLQFPADQCLAQAS
jgi:glycosyltransferase involved in cell wall biosynthesis